MKKIRATVPFSCIPTKSAKRFIYMLRKGLWENYQTKHPACFLQKKEVS
jgi:hypothetical protein